MIETSLETYWEVYSFLMREAELLDERREREWLESCIADDVEYLMPVRENRERSEGVGFSDESFYFQDTRGSLELRVKRLETEYAWAEDPPSRTRHFVTNVRVAEGEEERGGREVQPAPLPLPGQRPDRRCALRRAQETCCANKTTGGG